MMSTDAGLALLRVLRWRPPSLRFDADRESRFLRANAPAKLRHLIASGLVALVAYNLYLLSDRIMVPDVFEQAVRLRLFVFTPMALAVIVISLRFRPWVLSLPPCVADWVIAMSGVLAAMSVGVLLAQTDSPYAVMYRAGLISILIYGNLVQRLRFRYALAFSTSVLVICLIDMWITVAHQRLNAVVDVPVSLLILVIGSYTLIMNFRMELEERRRFLRTERAAILRQEIEESRLALDELSRRDALTGIPNRRHFDETLAKYWCSHRTSQQNLALLMIDVDHFKAYNDRYGHPTGDQCLRYVSQLLQGMVPASAGCVARWGGEEFIVVLPHTDAQRALSVARAMTDAVEGLGLRHEASPTLPNVTISIGVAVAVPGEVLISPDEIIAKADAALYRAKHDGRNRCALAAREVSWPA